MANGWHSELTISATAKLATRWYVNGLHRLGSSITAFNTKVFPIKLARMITENNTKLKTLSTKGSGRSAALPSKGVSLRNREVEEFVKLVAFIFPSRLTSVCSVSCRGGKFIYQCFCRFCLELTADRGDLRRLNITRSQIFRFHDFCSVWMQWKLASIQ